MASRGPTLPPRRALRRALGRASARAFATAAARTTCLGLVAASVTLAGTGASRAGPLPPPELSAASVILFNDLGDSESREDLGAAEEFFLNLARSDGTGSLFFRGNVEWNPDPYHGLAVSVANPGSSAQGFILDFRMPMVPITGANDIRGILDLTLQDADGDGTASFTGGVVASNASILATGGEEGTSAFAFDQVFPSLAAPGAVTAIDVSGAGVDPADFGLSEWDGLGMSVAGVLSPGDALVIEAFGCIVNAGRSCPARPDLSVPVSGPPAMLLVGAALLAGLGSARRR